MATQVIRWSRPTYTGHLYTEVWRHGSQLADTLAATVEASATELGDTSDEVFTDHSVSRGTTYFYYLRHVNSAGEKGAFVELQSTVETITAADVSGLGDLATQDNVNNDDWSGAALALGNGGTGSTTPATARTALGIGSIGTQDSNSVDIDGGAIDGTAIGQSVTASGTFSNLRAVSTLRLPAAPPASATAAGAAGRITYDSNYLYVCVATNTWKRVAIATWP